MKVVVAVALSLLLVATLVIGALGVSLSTRGYELPLEYGTVVATVEGVPIFYHEPGKNRRGKFGLEFQCVEFVNRWLVAKGYRNLSRTGDAPTYFEKARAKGLTPFPNGGMVPPEKGDVIVFLSSAQPNGHVGIVLEVKEGEVLVAQQNATLKAFGGLLVKPLPFEKFKMQRSASGWTVLPSEPLTCIGWSRPAKVRGAL